MSSDDLVNSLKISKCAFEGHYYKIDYGNDKNNKIYVSGTDSIDPDKEIISRAQSIGVTFYVKCARCGHRILINDKSYELRKKGEYTL